MNSLERLKIDAVRREGLQELLGSTCFHTSKRVATYDSRQFGEFVDSMVQILQSLHDVGIDVFHMPLDVLSEGSRRLWIPNIEYLETPKINKAMRNGTFKFPSAPDAVPGMLFTADHYHKGMYTGLDYLHMLHERLPGFDTDTLQYVSEWGRLMRAFFGIGKSISPEKFSQYAKVATTKIYPAMRAAIADLISHRSEDLLRVTRRTRMAVDQAVIDGTVDAAATALLFQCEGDIREMYRTYSELCLSFDFFEKTPRGPDEIIFHLREMMRLGDVLAHGDKQLQS